MNNATGSLEYLRSLLKYPLFEAYPQPQTCLSNCGVYVIFVEPNNKIYIGSTGISFTKRIRSHKHRLKKNIHHTVGLQHSFNKYGADSLSISFVKIIDKLDYLDINSFKAALLKEEQYWIDLAPKNLLLNCCLIAGSSLGRHLSEDHKNALSLLGKERVRLNPDIIAKMVAGTKSWASVEENRIALSERCKKNFGSVEAMERKAISLRSPKTRCLQSLNGRRIWQSLEHRQNISKKLKEFYSSPGAREARSEVTKVWASLPGNKERVSIETRKRFEDPEYRRKNKEHLISTTRKNASKTGERTKGLWADEDHRKMRSRNIQRAQAKKSLPFYLVSPSGETYVTDSICAFAQRFGLGQTGLAAVVRGAKQSFKCWTGKTLESWDEVPDEAIRVLWAEHGEIQ